MAVATLGCKVNQYESAGILEALLKEEFSIVPFTAEADCYIINTCTVTGRADYQSRQLIRRASRRNPEASIIVTGCYAQVAPHEIACLPGVTVVAGNAEKEKIPAILREMVNGKKRTLVGNIRQVREVSRLPVTRFSGHTRAFLKIQDGCNSFCSFCIVPFARGRSRSLPEGEVMDRIAMLSRSGHREVVLTGIHLGAYGQDLNPPANLLHILRNVEEQRIVERLRLSSLEPTEITDEMISLMKDAEIICRHLHIPLQSGDDKILSLMGRSYDTASFRRLLEKIWHAIPDIAIGTDVMVGHPGEGENEFKNTVRLLEELPLAYLHVFPYSERPGTRAARLPGRVGQAEKKRRVEILKELGKQKRDTFAERFKEKKLPVLIETEKDSTGFMRGFSDNYIPVVITGGNSSLANQIVYVIPDHVQDGKLFGKLYGRKEYRQ
ncbi:MAG: tRNA (N(6)-L-threonylcarbamoyladenosine(37)-C(2))-methylthiotransferase MtaB [Syntrophales bacterium]|nr:tRNA (N(6)-L-threonylcarbamoyladenosine(37)-C(2))-methylthiotransferase MtaB [Syntrophales bacterium]